MICSSRLTGHQFKEGIKGDGINTPDYTKHLKKTELGLTQLKSLPFEYSSEMLGEVSRNSRTRQHVCRRILYALIN